jgi:DNA polymerase III subunit epsilon
MEFVAIDVETANPDFSSICQIGIVRYTSGCLSEEWKTYVDPEDFFSPINISIHGIDESTVQGAPKLYELANKIYHYLDNNVVISHTHFDRVSLNQAFNKYSLRYPEPIWLDSARVARRTWEKFAWSGYGLINICKEIGYEFRCHDALEDAKAAAVVFLAAIERSGLDINGWLRRVEQPIDPNYIQPIKRDGNPEGSLYGNNLVFTGALEIPRREAAEMAARIGCNVQTGVNKDTTMLVVGNQDIRRLVGHEKSSKHRKAEELIIKGHDIRIISEKDFEELVKSVCGTRYELTSKKKTTTNKLQSRKSIIENETKDTLPIDELKAKMIESLSQDSKREYLQLCKQHYSQAVSIHQELFPEFYGERCLTDPFDSLYTKAVQAKKEGNTDEEIRILETAIANDSTIPGCYESLAILYSKAKKYEKAYEVSKKWFDYGFWKMPQASTTSLRLLDRLEKLEQRI